MRSPIKVRQDTLSQLPDIVSRPTYDREVLTAGIMHIGVGGFHRSHQAWYTDKLIGCEKDASRNWAICGVGLREGDREMAEILKKQDYLYTLIIRHPDGAVNHQVIGSLIDFILAVDDPQAVIDRMADEQTRIVSLTITEGGYNFDPATGEFDFSQADIKHDLAHPQKPRTVFGYLTQALRQRRKTGVGAFTIQSCDNIEHNGDVARKMLLAFARELDDNLAKWIDNEVSFPNAMVDRITPATKAADIESLEAQTGIIDQWPVTCEPFSQWVIENRFVQGRPKWESVGAQFVDDVTPYETMKLRLLNAGHSVLGLLGSLHGHETIDDCIADPLFARFVRNFMDVEATSVLDPVKGIDLEDYKDTLIQRFGNPTIKDDLSRICSESSAKLPKFLLPTVHE
ncbi:mannitol dehydrogenase family protein, partial [bacterium]|nr:mannitol dehydrogenase family protein [bacterium]